MAFFLCIDYKTPYNIYITILAQSEYRICQSLKKIMSTKLTWFIKYRILANPSLDPDLDPDRGPEPGLKSLPVAQRDLYHFLKIAACQQLTAETYNKLLA